jgi:hypothetical protein
MEGSWDGNKGSSEEMVSFFLEFISKSYKLKVGMWITPISPAIQEAEIERITVWGQLKEKVSETLTLSTSWAW